MSMTSLEKLEFELEKARQQRDYWKATADRLQSQVEGNKEAIWEALDFIDPNWRDGLD